MSAVGSVLEVSLEQIVSLDGRPIGLPQRAVISDYHEDVAELAATVDVADGAVELPFPKSGISARQP